MMKIEIRADSVVIDGYDYPVNVTAENVRSMVKSVVDKVAFKL